MSQTLAQIFPELMVMVFATLALFVGLSGQDSVRRLAQSIAALGLLVALWLTLKNTQPAPAIARYVSLLTYVVGFLSVLVAWDMPFKSEPGVCDSRYRGEFFAMMLFSLAGVAMVGKVNDIVWLFIVLELVSIPTYIMVATGRAQAAAQEAGIKYFFLGALAAAVYLFGFSYLYGYAGSTQYSVIASKLAADIASGQGIPGIALIGLLLTFLGISYKIAAVPMHFYASDVYQGAATPVTAFLAYAPKAAGFVAMIQILSLTSWQIPGSHGNLIPSLLTLMAILTMTIGNVLALLQRNIKRMLAYSSIAHSGYMLVGLVAGLGKTSDLTSNGIAATLFYLASYSFMNLGVFAVLVYLQGKSEAGENLDDLAGVAREHPVAAAAMAVCLFSLIGMPLTVGFLGKMYLVQAALANGYNVLAVITVLNAAVAAAYYLKVIASMYLRESWTPFAVRRTGVPQLSIGICAAAVVLFGLMPNLLIRHAVSSSSTHTVAAPTACSCSAASVMVSPK